MAGKNPWYDSSKAHHTPEGFRNPEPEQRKPGDLKRWRRERKAQALPAPPQQGYAAFTRQWWQPADISGSDDRIWWLGHAAVLLRLNGHYILIDPALSPRASPLAFAGPQRKTPAPISIADLPQQATFIVPLGLAKWCRAQGVKQVHQIDWWQQVTLGDLCFDAVPARHWSMRTPCDRNRSLWCGWVVRSASLRFWFSGDSGYSDILLEIPVRLGPFSVAALPIGAYAPKWFMASQHMDPDQAVALWQAAGRPLTLPIHWGVFELADESLDAPPQELANALQRADEHNDRFAPWRIGEGRSLNNCSQE
ncbi:MBL fold metallo-hydrolase [Pantoea vagans]|uniref:MBL fold metallo-hydrolase n=1 Tax=Pantoea vagans TaxID=470934 RepID=UPI0028A71115|nr:MBL fold metallo-hydrolase [Pantoea vagans]